jgi:hypothetical protein
MQERVVHEFVEYIPETLREGTVYVSMRFATAVHRCCCGCGREVVTPLSPTAWKLIFDGRSISLRPSIGNWSFPCRSHYWITNDRIEPAMRWSTKEIAAGRAEERRVRERYEAEVLGSAGVAADMVVAPDASVKKHKKKRMKKEGLK